MPFHAGKGGVYIGPNQFENEAQKCQFLNFQGPGSTTACHLSLSGTTTQSGRYYRLTALENQAQAVPSPDRGGTTAKNSWETESPRRCHRRLGILGPNGVFYSA